MDAFTKQKMMGFAYRRHCTGYAPRHPSGDGKKTKTPPMRE